MVALIPVGEGLYKVMLYKGEGIYGDVTVLEKRRNGGTTVMIVALKPNGIVKVRCKIEYGGARRFVEFMHKIDSEGKIITPPFNIIK